MKKQNIENLFSSMENFSSVPPPELWGQIEEKLNKPKKKKRAILWWSAAACLLLGLMLPSVLYFNSLSEIKTGNNSSIENNSVVLDENKADINQNRTIPDENTIINQKSDNSQNRSLENNNTTNDPQKNNATQETAVADADSPNITNTKVSSKKLSIEKKSTNEVIAEKSSVSAKQNAYNTPSKNQTLNSERNTNQAVAEKTVISGNQNAFNSVSKNQTLNSERNTNQALAEKTVISGNKNTFNSSSKNQILNAERNANQGIAGKTTISGNQNAFNSVSKNQIADAEKKNANKILAEKTFSSGKQNPFNPTSKNQVAHSLFETKPNLKSNKNNTNLPYNSPDQIVSTELNNKAKKDNREYKNEPVISEKAIADNQQNNSKFIDALSKQDSVQLAELQNLEKGITNPEDNKEKETKPKSESEKWAVQVFAGVANSENYKNDKTLGHVNDSKQTSTYGVKTKYKINKKWAVGSGLKINELGQSIANVSYMDVSEKNSAFFSPSEYFVKNVATPQIASNRSYVFVSNSTKDALASENVQTGNLDQSLRYIEMPLEVSYAVFNKNRTNISLNTGGFVGKLISNNVALDGTTIGKNLDANDFVYGSVLSSTVQYRIYKKTNVFVEPAMNYYINPLNNQSFNQLQWGLNFGLNVSF
ncbi:hypothetical protein [Flavobacterium sp. HTF]|uniref:hypothetical protein n=1 Tax=Flavobacterium sp. HTF TaxID=2170732 RepID=UPI000D5C7146|nr:hypothetical protein [Flavobacterium sp. HTF]PWB23266.1 hypothetical protein DCO46_14880 [Flavobacterium sp. HTF]